MTSRAQLDAGAADELAPPEDSCAQPTRISPAAAAMAVKAIERGCMGSPSVSGTLILPHAFILRTGRYATRGGGQVDAVTQADARDACEGPPQHRQKPAPPRATR